MAKPGPKKLPKAVLEARGSTHLGRKDRGNLSRPTLAEPLTKSPPAPKHLCKQAAAIWRPLVKALVERRILSAADLAPLERYCTLRARWLTLIEQNQLDADKQIDIADEARLSRVLCNYSDRMQKIEDRFGLTPSSVRDCAPLREPMPTELDASDKFFAENVALKFVK